MEYTPIAHSRALPPLSAHPCRLRGHTGASHSLQVCSPKPSSTQAHQMVRKHADSSACMLCLTVLVPAYQKPAHSCPTLNIQPQAHSSKHKGFASCNTYILLLSPCICLCSDPPSADGALYTSKAWPKAAHHLQAPCLPAHPASFCCLPQLCLALPSRIPALPPLACCAHSSGGRDHIHTPHKRCQPLTEGSGS